MRETRYSVYVIKLDVHQVGKGHPAEGKWVSGEYMIGRHTGAAYTEKKFVHQAAFFITEAEAESQTLELAKRTIDLGRVGFKEMRFSPSVRSPHRARGGPRGDSSAASAQKRPV